MKDGKHKKKTEARNNLITTANIPHSTEDKPEHESLGVIVQQQWQHPERPIGITGGNTSKSRLHVASSPLDPHLRASPTTNTSSLAANQETGEKVATTGREVTTPNKEQAQIKPRPKKQPENANQKEIRLERNRRTAKARREKQLAETDAKQQKITELAIQNNVLRQKIQNKLQELVGLGVYDAASAINEKMNLLVSSFTLGTSATRENERSSLDGMPPSDSLLPVASSTTEEFNKALQLLLQQERSKHNPQQLKDAQLHGPQQALQRPQQQQQQHLNTTSNAPQQQQQQQLLVYDQHRTPPVELYSIRVRQLQQQVVHSNDREQQSPCYAGQGMCHDEIALDQKQKATDYQGELKGILCEKDRQLADHRRQELRKKRQRIRQDEIALHQRHKQEQQMIDYRRQQLKEEEEEVDGGGERQSIQEDRRNSLSQDCQQQVLGNLRQKLSGGFSHETDQRQLLDRQQQQVKDQTLNQKLGANQERKNAKLDVAQRLQEDQNHDQQDTSNLNYEKDQCAIQAEQNRRRLEDHRQRMHQNEISMSQQAQSQQQNDHYPNHLKDQEEDQKQEPREDYQGFRQQRRPPLNNQRYIFHCDDQMSLTQNQSITRYCEQHQEQQTTTDQNQQLFGWQEGQIEQHVIDVQQMNKQADTYDREEHEPQADQQQQRGTGRQEQEQQWAQQGQYQCEDQVAAERGRQEHLHEGMEDDLSLAQRNQLAGFLQQQMEQIGREESTQCLETTEKKDPRID